MGTGRWLRAEAVVLCAVLATACSDDNAANDTIPLPSATSTSIAPSKTSPPPTTSGSTTTVVPTVLTAPTTEPVTMTVPVTEPTMASTTSVSNSQVEAEVRTAFETEEAAWLDCKRQLPACDPASLVGVYEDPQLTAAQDLVRQWNAAGDHLRNLESVKHSVKFVSIAPDGTSAVVRACFVDGAVRYRVGGSVEVIVDDRVGYELADLSFRQSADGMWRMFTSTTVNSSTDGSPVCDVG